MSVNPDVEELLKYNRDPETRKWREYCDVINVIWDGFPGGDAAAAEVARRESEWRRAHMVGMTFSEWKARG